MQGSVRNYKLLEISIFCQKHEENKNLAKYSYRLTWSLWEKTLRNCQFTKIAFIGHKRAGNFELALLVQNSMQNYELRKIIVFCQKSEENNNLTKYSHCLTWKLRGKGRTTVNLPKLVCVVYNIQGKSTCCFR